MVLDMKRGAFLQIYHLDIQHSHGKSPINGGFNGNGNIIYKWAILHGYVSHYQRVHPFISSGNKTLRLPALLPTFPVSRVALKGAPSLSGATSLTLHTTATEKKHCNG